MSSPGTRNTVGKVGVRVVPDTTRFHKELKTYLEKLEKSLKITVRVEFNEAQALAELKKLQRVLEESAEITLDVKFNEKGVESLSRQVDKMSNPLEAVAETFQRAATQVDKIGDKLIESRRSLASMVNDAAFWLRYTIQTNATVENAQKIWQRLVKTGTSVVNTFRRIPDLAAMSKNLASSAVSATKIGASRITEFVKDLGDAKTYSDAFYSSMELVGRTYERVGNKIRSIKISDVLRSVGKSFRSVGSSAVSAGKTVTQSFGRNIDRTIKGVSRGISKGLSAVGTAFSKVGSAAGSLFESIGSLTRTGWIFIAVLALAAPLVGLLATAIAALPGVLAVAGAGIAVVMLGLDGIKKAAQAAAPGFDKLKEAVSSTFAKELTPMFREIGTVLLPGITASLQGVAKGISDMAKGFITVITSKEGMAQMNAILGNISKLFSGLAPFMAEVAKWFLTLAEVGTGGLAKTAASLTSFMAQWNALIDTAKNTGVLQQAFAGLSQVMGSLGQVFLILFKTGLDAMAVLGGPMATAISTFGTFLGALMPILTTISGLVFTVVSAIGQALTPVIAALAPVIQKLAEMLGTLLTGAISALIPVIVPLATMIADVLLMALKALEPIIPILVTALQQLGTIVGSFLTQAFAALMPFVQQILTFASELLMSLMPLLPVIMELASTVLTALLNIFVQLVPIVMNVASTIFPMLLEIVKMLVPAIIEILNAIIPIIPELAKLAEMIIALVIPIMKILLNVIKEVWPTIQGIIKAALQVISGVIDVVMGIIKGDWEQAWNGIKKILDGAWKLIGVGVQLGIDIVMGFIKSLPKKALDALGNLGSYLLGAGKSLINGFLDGVKSAWNSITSFISGGLQKIRNLFPFSPAKEGPFSGKGYTLYSGRALATDWAKGIRQGIPAAQQAVQDMMSTSDETAMQFTGVVTSDGFGSIGDKVAEALEGWGVHIDGNGLAKIVNKANVRKDRRR